MTQRFQIGPLQEAFLKERENPTAANSSDPFKYNMKDVCFSIKGGSLYIDLIPRGEWRQIAAAIRASPQDFFSRSV